MKRLAEGEQVGLNAGVGSTQRVNAARTSLEKQLRLSSGREVSALVDLVELDEVG